MRISKIILFLVAASLAMTACKKEKDKLSNTQLLTQTPWVMVKYEEKEGNGAWEDRFPENDECSKDDKWIFKTNFTVDITEGNNACTGSTPNEVLESASWSFVDGESKLQVAGQTANIDQLDGNTLIISFSENLGGITYYTKVTLAH